jgi:hypothetical protein
MSDAPASSRHADAAVCGTFGPGPATLPKPLTGFIGREHELAPVRQLPQTDSLLTLTGSGGGCKTRLRIELAGPAYLARPDGSMAARGTSEQPGPIHDYLRALVVDASTTSPADDLGTVLDELHQAERLLPPRS